MKTHVRTLAGLFMACWAAPALAANCKPADASLSGLYQLRGVMESGSMIGLLPNGQFRYMLSVGAYDEAAQGCWQREGDSVVLIASEFKKNAPSVTTFKRVILQVTAKGELIRQITPKQRGRYVRVRR